MKERTFTLLAATVTGVLSIGGGWLSSYYTFKGDIEKANSEIYASNIELVKQATAIIQDPKSPSGLKDWAIDVLARYVDVRISEDRRAKMLQVLSDNPGVSFKGLAEKYQTEIPEFGKLNTKLNAYDFWKGGEGLQSDGFKIPKQMPEGDIQQAPGGKGEPDIQQLPGGAGQQNQMELQKN